MDSEVSNFVDVTGSTAVVARGYLDLASGNLEQAIMLYFENPDLASNFNTQAPPPIPSHSRPSQARSANRPSGAANAGRQDASGVIHIDSGDDDDDHMTLDDDDDELEIPDDDDDDDNAALQAARAAQEDEDAAMAKRMQEELYSDAGAAATADGIRSPIARTTETLVAPSQAWDPEDDMASAIMEQMAARRRRTQPRPTNPFAQSVWDDRQAPAPGASSSAARGLSPPPPLAPVPAVSENGSRAQRLAELFRPPYELMTVAPWDTIRTAGKEEKKWIMVNLQDMSDFQCQALNRDIWRDSAVRQLVGENFIFLQYSKGDVAATEYTTFYFPHQSHENPDVYPHVSIIDPRTGEQVKVWSGKPFPTASEFHTQLVEFLDRYSLAANSKNPVAKAARRQRVVDVDRMTEEEMLEMALQNSLETSDGGAAGGAKPTANVFDPDDLTKSPLLARDQDPMDKTKGKQPANRADTPQEDEEGDLPGPAATPGASQSAFAQISSNNPHEEPANNPATTTRIQFRHPTGRVIRRFSLQDRVERLYEWLKAEPLEGQEGVVFELKTMPAGRDLLGDLDKTIEEAGLKQGTVMIEFIAD